MRHTGKVVIAAVLGVAAFTFADEKGDARPPTAPNRKAAAEALTTVSEQAKVLRQEAKAITKKISEVTAQEDLTSNDQAVKTLQDLVQQLAKVNEQLKKVQEDVDGIKAWIKGEKDTLPALGDDVKRLKNVSWGNYVQFQWQDTQEGRDANGKPITTNDGFAMRRFRISTTNKIDAQSSMKLAFDVAAGSQHESAELKEAILSYDAIPTKLQVFAGQMPMPLGTDLQRSSSEREFPEYTLYNRTLFASEDGRGINLRYNLDKATRAELGVFNSLTYGDPQQTDANTFRNLNGTHPAFTGSLRRFGKGYDFGVTGFVGDRPGTSSKTTTTWTDSNGNGAIDPGEVKNTVVPATAGATRQFLYIDGNYAGLFDRRLTVRGEYMVGKDRVPTLSGGIPLYLKQTDVMGYNLLLSYALNKWNVLSAREEWFDPDTSTARDATGTFGLAFTHFFNPGVKLTVSHEWVNQQGFDRPDDVTTIRLQYKF